MKDRKMKFKEVIFDIIVYVAIAVIVIVHIKVKDPPILFMIAWVSGRVTGYIKDVIFERQ